MCVCMYVCMCVTYMYGTYVTANNSPNNNVLFFFISD